MHSRHTRGFMWAGAGILATQGRAESLYLGLCLVTGWGWGCRMLRLCSKAQGRKLEGTEGWIGRGGKEKGPSAHSLMLWPRVQVLDFWPHQRHNGCKTSQLVSKWEECQPWFLLPKEWKVNNNLNNHSYDSCSSSFIPKHFTERPFGPAKKFRARSQDTWTPDLCVEDLEISWGQSLYPCNCGKWHCEEFYRFSYIISLDPPTLVRKAENVVLLF